MARLSTEDLLSQFKEMSLVELSDFVKAFETEFDVTAAAPVAVVAAGLGVEADVAGFCAPVAGGLVPAGGVVAAGLPPAAGAGLAPP